jgi:cytochrome c
MKRTAVVLSGAVLASLLAVTGVRAAEDGASVYKAQCAKCHGESGKADTAAAKAMKAPALAGDAKIAAMSEADLVKAIKENKKHAGVVSKLSAEQLAAAAAHVKTLAK